jgi:hypothetical protein
LRFCSSDFRGFARPSRGLQAEDPTATRPRPSTGLWAGWLTIIARGAGFRFDAVAFVAAFKGVFLEGLEVTIIAITFGAAARQLWVAYARAPRSPAWPFWPFSV